MVRESFKRTTPQERSAPALAYRLLLLNFAAISTSTIAATNALLEIKMASLVVQTGSEPEPDPMELNL